MKRPAESKNRNALRGGAYALTISVVVLALLLLANVFAAALPASWTKFDISAAKLYSITSNTKVVVNALKEDVTIYWIVQSGEEDDVIENLLDKYESLSEHLQIIKKNPDVYPTFAAQYTDETVQNNSLVVECGEKSRYIGIDDIYTGELNPYTGTYSATDFDGEGAVTSAIDYVVSDELPRLYLLEGHGEKELPAGFSGQIEKENMETVQLSLLTADEIPKDAACIVIYSPASDISQEEQKMLEEYTAQGGKLLVVAGPTEDGTLENLYGLLSEYGVTPNEGIVIEGDREYYAFRAPYVLLPDLASHEITDPLIEENYRPILPIAQGLTVSGTDSAVTRLLITSDDSFSKAAGYTLDTYEREEGDTDGPFTVAVSVETEGEGKIVWFASSEFLEEMYNAYASGANVDIAMNALSYLVGETEAVAIRSKSLNYSYLTISESTASLLKVIMIGICPALYLITGIVVVLRRRRRQNGTV